MSQAATMQPRATTNAAAIRGTRVAWSALSAQFRRNLAIFDERTRLGADLERDWRTAAGKLELWRLEDGSFQVFSRLADAPGWLPAFCPAACVSSEDSLRAAWKGQVLRTIAICGVGLGFALRDVLRASRETFLQYSAPVFVVERSRLALAVVLHLHDWADLLAQPRVRLCAGPLALEQFKAELGDIERGIPVLVSGGPAWPGALPDAELQQHINAADAHRQQLQQNRLAQLADLLPQRSAAEWAERFAAAAAGAAPLSIVGVTSRYTTVLQYSMRDLLSAFERAGHRTHLFIEADDNAHFAPLRLLDDLARQQPDLVIMIDHLQQEYPHALPTHVPSVCWVQDHLPHLFRSEAGRAVRPLEVVIGSGRDELVGRFGYPAGRFMPCRFPTNPAALCDPEECETDLAPYRCDLMFATNVSATIAERRAAHRARLPEAGRRLFDETLAMLDAEVRDADFCGDLDHSALLTQAERRSGVAIADAAQRADLVNTLSGLADQHLREETIRAAARWADETGRRFHLYGRGWGQRPEFARFSRGVVPHGVELGRACRGAKVCLHAGCNPALHQRVLDGLCAGGFFLIREKLSDTEHALYRSVIEFVERNGKTPPFHFRPADLPQPYSDWARRSWKMYGMDIERGVIVDEKLLAHCRAELERTRNTTASGLWPRYERLIFSNGAELAAKLEHFLTHEDERRSLAAEMRAAVLDHFTYDGLVRELLAFMPRALAASSSA